MSPQCLAILLQHSRSAAVIATLGTAHAITGIAANNVARVKTPTLRMNVNRLIVVATVNKTQQEASDLAPRFVKVVSRNLRHDRPPALNSSTNLVACVKSRP